VSGPLRSSVIELPKPRNVGMCQFCRHTDFWDGSWVISKIASGIGTWRKYSRWEKSLSQDVVTKPIKYSAWLEHRLRGRVLGTTWDRDAGDFAWGNWGGVLAIEAASEVEKESQRRLWKLHLEILLEPGVVVHSPNPSTQEVKATGSWVPGQSVPHRATPSGKLTNNPRNKKPKNDPLSKT
jgi:hypothetical protein